MRQKSPTSLDQPQPFNSNLVGISQGLLDISEKLRSNGFAWRGQFSPQLVEALLDAYAPNGALVVDPFVGSGTVLIEAARKGMKAMGVEVNPSAFLLARFYEAVNWPSSRRQAVLKELSDGFLGHFDMELGRSALEEKEAAAQYLQAKLLELRKEVSADTVVVLETLIILLDFTNKPLTEKRLRDVWKRVSSSLLALPIAEQVVQCILGDSRSLPLEATSVDLVLTSPPYINVFNYHQQYRKSCEAMGWKPLVSAQSEIGANRKFRQNRFYTVTQYCLDMNQVLLELKRVCKPSAHLILVLGRESRVRKTPFPNGEILKRLAERCAGFKVELLQERTFLNKFGMSIAEDVIHLSLNGQKVSDTPTEVAIEILTEALDQAPQESLSDLRDAIAAARSISPSPLFDSSKSK